MLSYDWENSVAYWVCSASHVFRKTLDARLAPEGITVRQWEVLAWLSARGCGSQAVLAEQLGIEPHTLAGVLTRMEKAGLLTRKPCEDDRRKNTLHPTKKAENVWDRVADIAHDIRKQATTGFSPEELQIFREMCERVLQNLDEEVSLSDSATFTIPDPCSEAVDGQETELANAVETVNQKR